MIPAWFNLGDLALVAFEAFGLGAILVHFLGLGRDRRAETDLAFIEERVGTDVKGALWWTLPAEHRLRMQDAQKMPLGELVEIVRQARP